MRDLLFVFKGNRGQIFGAPLEVLTCQHKPMRGVSVGIPGKYVNGKIIVLIDI